jgi:YbbR domain-containing protein
MRDLFIKDWGWKLFSIFLAVAIWLTVHRILEPEATLLADRTKTIIYENLPVKVISSVTDVSLYHVTPGIVKVTVSGPPEVMDQLKASQVRAVVDLADSASGSGQVSILAPPNVSLVHVDPQTVFVTPPQKH